MAECRPRHEKKKMKNITENRVWGGREERQANLKREATAATRYIVLSVSQCSDGFFCLPADAAAAAAATSSPMASRLFSEA